jgi:hypothetical protein
MKTSLKIYNPVWGVDVARDWGLAAEEVDLETALTEPYRLICVPACFTDPDNFNYQDFCRDQIQIDFSRFNLVVISDIEQEKYSDIQQWINSNNIGDHILSIGASHGNEAGTNDETTILRSWWMRNLMRMNTYKEHMQSDKPYWFDVLLGARRPHRDFVMLSLQKHSQLLDKCIVTYRDGFSGEIINNQTDDIHNYFPDYTLAWPYVSKNLNHSWEVKDTIEKSISPFVPWEIYRQTWYTVVCETNYTGDGFFLTEKTTKALFAKRLFVMFAPCYFLQKLRELGFKTFGSVIDESYDSETQDLKRYQMAFAQMLSLTQQDPVEVYKKVEDILAHNRQHLTELQNKIDTRMEELLTRHIPKDFWLS